MYYLGVDGGGSKTAFVLITEKGNIAARTVLGTCHYMQVGMDGFRNIISEGIDSVCDAAGIKPGAIEYSFLGLPGYGENQQDAQLMKGIVREILPGDFICGNDSQAGWAGATGCKPGINVVSGTGSIVFGIDDGGNSARAGGWGEFCGDEGSAYWIAKGLIELFTKEADGRIPKSPLYDLIKTSLGLKRDFDIITLVKDTYGLQRNKIAALSEIAYEAAVMGDLQCIELFNQAADELALCVKAAFNQLFFRGDGKIPVCCTGGVFKAGKIIMEPFAERLADISLRLILQQSILKPDIGSAYYAWVIKHKTQNEELLYALKQSSL